MSGPTYSATLEAMLSGCVRLTSTLKKGKA